MLLPHTITSALASARSADDLETAAEHRRMHDLPHVAATHRTPEVTIRLARPDDARELDRLAQLDGRGAGWVDTITGRWGRESALGEVLVAESRGAIIAARPLRGSAPAIADPFRPSSEVLALLEVRADQLTGTHHAGRRLHRVPRSAPVLRVGGAR